MRKEIEGIIYNQPRFERVQGIMLTEANYITLLAELLNDHIIGQWSLQKDHREKIKYPGTNTMIIRGDQQKYTSFNEFTKRYSTHRI